jgi:hypothetical protein
MMRANTIALPFLLVQSFIIKINSRRDFQYHDEIVFLTESSLEDQEKTGTIRLLLLQTDFHGTKLFVLVGKVYDCRL